MESFTKLQLRQDLMCISAWGSSALDLGSGSGMLANGSSRPETAIALRASRYRRYDRVEGLTLPRRNGA